MPSYLPIFATLTFMVGISWARHRHGSRGKSPSFARDEEFYFNVSSHTIYSRFPNPAVKGRAMKEKKEVVKHSAAVQIQNNITLLQRRAWNVLLTHAYDALVTEERHKIRIKDLMQALEFTSKN